MLRKNLLGNNKVFVENAPPAPCEISRVTFDESNHAQQHRGSKSCGGARPLGLNFHFQPFSLKCHFGGTQDCGFQAFKKLSRTFEKKKWRESADVHRRIKYPIG